ncbi:XapX domain-containing protein [Caloranaerobacter azorensis]|uniref:XapX domain-containing protein n=1 Tax=Caloranaerobacter azorensis DSM 13643 TaxID=1121264 RepID=A0A1M5SSV5_9FIRM|nr:DUF1427 family protein [Caloranaerobacter azorensis]SHH41560.1 XapX domain-containing protein [Caloranaerobacter azorensis DSM 13643]
MSKIDIKEMALSLVTGMLVGIVFKALKFPLPAPPNIPAFMGVFGVWLGSTLVKN